MIEQNQSDLTTLTQRLLEIFDCEICGAGEKIMAAVMMHDRERLRACYELLSRDIGCDLLQRIYQYHLADREKNKQDFTPLSIGRLLDRVTPDEGVIYDLCAGSGSLTIQKWSGNQDATFICEEIDHRVIPFLLLNLVVRNIDGWVIHRNALTLETNAVYQLKASETFSLVQAVGEPPILKANAIISNPPYNIPWQPPDPLFADERFGLGIPPKSNANLAFVLTALSRLERGGKCAFVLPVGVLTSSNERPIRKTLIDAGLLETVIALPDSMFESTDIPVCVIIFGDGHAAQGHINVLDCRKFFDVEMRFQNGQYGGKSHEGRTYHKEIKTFSDQRISEILASFGKPVPGLAARPSLDDIAKQDYILTPSRYISQTEEVKKGHRPYEEIIDDINRICRERNVVRITVNETLARELGLAEICEAVKSSQENAKGLEKTFALFGKKVIQSDYIGLSKNKNELRIENRDKEYFSSLLAIFLPMWRQHIFYLNMEENRLLAELRDALIPDLMSGKIVIPHEEVNV
jgi:type I restriction-modification system DNA methylase subunit